MEYRRLGSTGLDVSVVGIGGWPLGGLIGGPVGDLLQNGIRAMVALGISEGEADRVLIAIQNDLDPVGGGVPTLEELVREGLRRCASTS